MNKQRIKTRVWQGVIAGVAAAVMLGMAAPESQAAAAKAKQVRPQVEKRVERQKQRVDRRKKRVEHRKDRLDRRDHRLDRRDNRLDRREHRQDWRKDRRERREHRQDRVERWHSRHHKRDTCVRVVPWRSGWYRTAPQVRFHDSVFYLNGDLDVYFGGVGIHLDLGDRAPDGYVYVHAGTGKRFQSVRTFRSWCRENPRELPYLIVVPCR